MNLNQREKKAAILFIIDGLEFGGGERVFLQLASGLRNDFEIFVAAMPGGEFEQGLRQLGVTFYPVDMSRRLSCKPSLHITNIIRNNKIDLLHSQGARADFFARIAGKTARVSHIVCTIAMPVEGFNVGILRKGIYRFIDHLTERYVERFIVVSDSLKQNLIERRRIPANRIVRIYNGIEPAQYHSNVEYSNPRKEWRVPQDHPLIGAIGRMVWQKGFKYLIEAASEILRAVPEARFLFVGDGPLKENLEALGQKLNAKSRFIFTGFRSEIKEILSAIDVLVIPSLLEGFPMITLEAMAMAKPIIASNIDGIAEQITDGKNGILVPPRDSGAIAKAIIKILADKENGRKMGMAAGRRVEEKFSVEKMVAETEKLYLSLLEAN